MDFANFLQEKVTILQQKIILQQINWFFLPYKTATQTCKIIIVKEGYMPYLVVKIRFISSIHPSKTIIELFSERTSNSVFIFPSRCVSLLSIHCNFLEAMVIS